MTRLAYTVPLILAATFLAGACGGGSSGGTSGDRTSSDLILVDASVADADGVPLNEIITFEFSEKLDPDTVRADTILIREGPNFGKQVPGSYRVDGNTVEFFPRLPVLPDLSDAGLQPGSVYRISLPAPPRVATVRSFRNDRLRKAVSTTFQTATLGSSSLYVDNFVDPAPPRVLFGMRRRCRHRPRPPAEGWAWRGSCRHHRKGRRRRGR